MILKVGDLASSTGLEMNRSVLLLLCFVFILSLTFTFCLRCSRPLTSLPHVRQSCHPTHTESVYLSAFVNPPA